MARTIGTQPAASDQVSGPLTPTHLRQASRLVLALVLAALPLSARPAAALANCTISGGFATLRERIPDKIGDCLENEQTDARTGNAEQRTTLGLLTWRKADGLLAFTDGTTTWFLRQTDLLQRANTATPFSWEAAVLPPSPAAGGSKLWAESFNDPSSEFCRGLKSRQWVPQCADGEFRVLRGEQATSWAYMVPLGLYANTTVAVDARLVTGVERRAVTLVCREQGPDLGGGYHFAIQPALGQAALHRAPLEPSEEWVALGDWQRFPAIHRGQEINHLELTCSGTTISASINGSPAFEVQDQTYQDGATLLRVESWADGVPVDARFDNAAVTER
jgi:hypothetical protein